MGKLIYCDQCEKVTKHREKMDAFKEGFGVCNECDHMNIKCRLLKSDSTRFIKASPDVLWLEYNEDGTFKNKFEKISVGRCLIMSPFNHFYTWQTTMVTEVIEESPGYVKFKTENSLYELYYPVDFKDEDEEE
jgi:hypothetical protein